MPPQRAKKQPASKSNASLDSDVVASFPVPPTNTASAAPTPSAVTPTKVSASKRKMIITEQQKQALMDNLQLEVTERARKLRSQYGLLAQGLRSRLEMRVNRIPTALRKTNIMDVIEKYADDPRAGPPPSTIARPALRASESSQSSPVPKRGSKRNSEEVEDKENTQEQELVMPKKRAKLTGNQKKGPPAANSRARTVSRQDQPLQVLSPKSNNSRTYPHSPVKMAAEVEKAATKAVVHHTSPLKSNNILSPAEKPASKEKAGTGRGKKAAGAAATQEKKVTRSSMVSSDGFATDATTGTTIVKKKTPTAKKTIVKGTAAKSAGAKATAAAKKGKENAPAGAASRTLRTRAK